MQVEILKDIKKFQKNFLNRTAHNHNIQMDLKKE